MDGRMGEGSPRRRLLFAGVLVVVIVVGGAWLGAEALEDGSAGLTFDSFDYTYEDGEVTVTYTRGPSLTYEETGRLELVASSGTSMVWADSPEEFPVETGERAVLTGVAPGDTVFVIASNPDGDSLEILAELEITD